MAGELWRGAVQIGKETVYGTPVAATRIMYCRDPRLTRERDVRVHKFMTSTRETTRNVTLGPTKVSGKLALPVSAEIIEFLLMGLKGGVTATGAGADKTWTFKPDATFDSATIEWDDGARNWQAAGCYVDQINIKGSVDGENICTVDLFGKAMVQASKTGSLTQRVPAVFDGWESKLYIDDFGAAPGTTAVSGMLIDWDVTIKNSLGRKYTGDNTLNASAVTMGEVEVDAKITFEASPAAALTEYNNWDAATKRLVRLEFGNNAAIPSGSLKETVKVDLPGTWTAVDLSGTSENTRVYQFSLQAIYDPPNAYSVQVIVVTARTTAW